QDLADGDAGGVDDLEEERPAELDDVVLAPELVEVELALVDVEGAGHEGAGVASGEPDLAAAGDLDVAAVRGEEPVHADGEVEARVVERAERDLALDGCAAGIAAERDVDAEHAVVDDAERALDVAVADAHRLPERGRV